MWKLLEKPTTVKCTARLAKEFAEMEAAPKDRPLREIRIDRLLEIIQAGTFRTCNWASVCCRETGKTYRVNGKHTSHVLGSLNGDVKLTVWINLERYECDTLQDVANLYATFDSKISSRTVPDINRSYSAAHPDLCDLPARLINVSVGGLAWHFWETTSNKHRADARAALMIEHADCVVWISTILHGTHTADTKALLRNPVVGAMVRTWMKAKGPANEFWTLVKDGSGPKHTTGDRVLNKWLTRVTVNRGYDVTTRGQRVRVDDRQIFVKCIHAWNAWRKNEKTDLKYYANAKIPAAV